MFFIGSFSFVFVFLTFYLLPCECLYCSWLLSGIDSLSVFRSCVVLAGAVKEIRHWFAFSSICAYLCMAGGSVYSLPLFLFPLVIPSGSGFSALRNGPDGAVVRPVRPSGCGPFGFPPGPGGILSLPFRRFLLYFSLRLPSAPSAPEVPARAYIIIRCSPGFPVPSCQTFGKVFIFPHFFRLKVWRFGIFLLLLHSLSGTMFPRAAGFPRRMKKEFFERIYIRQRSSTRRSGCRPAPWGFPRVRCPASG